MTPAELRHRFIARACDASAPSVIGHLRVSTYVVGKLARRIKRTELGAAAPFVVLEPDLEKAAIAALRQVGTSGFLAAHDSDDADGLSALINKFRRGSPRLPGMVVGASSPRGAEFFDLGVDFAVVHNHARLIDEVRQFARDTQRRTRALIRSCDQVAIARKLSLRQAEIVFRISQGNASNALLAEATGVSRSTVIQQRKRMDAKLGSRWADEITQLIMAGVRDDDPPFETGAFALVY